MDSIIVDNEYLSLLDDFKKSHPNVPLIVDLVSNLHNVYLISSFFKFSHIDEPRIRMRLKASFPGHSTKQFSKV